MNALENKENNIDKKGKPKHIKNNTRISPFSINTDSRWGINTES
jgi:hypothetical protein